MVLNPAPTSFPRPESGHNNQTPSPTVPTTTTSPRDTNPGHGSSQLPQRSPFGIQQLLGLSTNGSVPSNRPSSDRFKNGHHDFPAPFPMSQHHHTNHHPLFSTSMVNSSQLNASNYGHRTSPQHQLPPMSHGQSHATNTPSSSSSSSSSSAPSPSFSAAATAPSFSQAAAAAADSAARLAYLTSSPAAAALMSASMASMSAHHHSMQMGQHGHPGNPVSMSMFHPAFGSVDSMSGVGHGERVHLFLVCLSRLLLFLSFSFSRNTVPSFPFLTTSHLHLTINHLTFQSTFCVKQ